MPCIYASRLYVQFAYVCRVWYTHTHTHSLKLLGILTNNTLPFRVSVVIRQREGRSVRPCKRLANDSVYTLTPLFEAHSSLSMFRQGASGRLHGEQSTSLSTGFQAPG